MVLSSIGTSGVVLKYEEDPTVDYHGVLQFEDHAIPDSYYSMGVTLAAGYSLNWFKRTLRKTSHLTTWLQRWQVNCRCKWLAIHAIHRW